MSIFSEERFLLELTLGTFPYILLLTLCLSRALQIQPLPSQNPYELPVSLRIKMFLTLVLAGLLATMTAFTLIFEDYWIDFWFSLIFLAQGFVLIIQIFVMGYEYKKMSPSPWYFNLLFWALSSFMYFIFLSNSLLFLDFKNNLCILIDGLRLALTLILLIFGIIIKQDLVSYRHQSPFLTKPLLAKYSLIENIEKKAYLSPTLQNPPPIPLKLTIKPLETPYFLLIISLPEISYSFKANLSTLKDLQTTLTHDNPSINLPSQKVYDSSQKTSQAFETFFRYFLDHESLLSPKLIDFLQIPNPYRKRLLKHKAKEEGNINKAYSSAGEDSREERDSLQGEKSFCPWFYVEYIEYKREGENSFYEYVFLITCNKGKEKRWTITKRYKEFLGLESGLKEIIKVNLPKLPGKQVFHNEDIIKERCLKLEEFLRVLLNESPYICPILIKFIEYREDPNYKDPLFSKEHVIYNETPLYQDEHIIDEPPFKGESIYKGKEESLWGTFSKDFLLDFPSIKNCYQGLQAREFESQLSFETNEGQFVIYLITIERGKGTFFCKLAKRYSDFEALNQALLIRFGHEIESLPELPGKLDFLEEKGSRGERLMEFLNTLLKKKGVEDCFAFRKFLGIDIKSLVN